MVPHPPESLSAVAAPRTIHVTLNGDRWELPAGTTLAELLVRLRVEPVRVAIEVDEELVSRRDFAATRLADGQRVEVVTFVGGG